MDIYAVVKRVLVDTTLPGRPCSRVSVGTYRTSRLEGYPGETSESKNVIIKLTSYYWRFLFQGSPGQLGLAGPFGPPGYRGPPGDVGAKGHLGLLGLKVRT